MHSPTVIPHFLTQDELALILKVEDAVRSVINKEIVILKNGRVERNFTACFSNEIAGAISLCNIRCDPFYNKHRGATKMLNGKVIELDIAVHERNIDDNNLVAIELETINNPTEDDLWKIKGLTHHLGGYGYKLGLYIVLGVSQKAGQVVAIQWFKNGELLPELKNGLKPGEFLV